MRKHLPCCVAALALAGFSAAFAFTAARPGPCAAGYVADGIATVRLLDAERLNAEWRAQQADNRLDGDPAWATTAADYERALGFASASLARCAGGLAA